MQFPDGLELGNYLYFGKELVKLTQIGQTELRGITKSGMELSIAPRLALPVPITKEMLLHYAFSEHRYTVPHSMHINYHFDLQIPITAGKPGDYIRVELPPGEQPKGRMMSGAYPASVDFHYLHELQNVYRWAAGAPLLPRR